MFRREGNPPQEPQFHTELSDFDADAWEVYEFDRMVTDYVGEVFVRQEVNGVMYTANAMLDGDYLEVDESTIEQE